ncbi:hypothetical protein MY4038_001221 [Beauveria bassiana]|uniref:Ribosome biogenesis protein ALB1 n=1 Tax=Beauveria bassiana TaxID=176275 RepID=A0A2N6NNV5_BEABA|nr:hypothetical protein BM221_005541 [Beauveria bassiana]
MPSVKNPNGPSKNRLAARAAKARKASQKRSAEGKHKIAKIDVQRGARPGLLPNSGPNARVSSKKARKLQKQMGHALRRKMAAEGEAVMTDAPEDEATKDVRQGPDETEMDGIQ